MKKIIIGQLMMWVNLLAVVIGYILFDMTNIDSYYVTGILGVLGSVGSGFNLFFAISLQFRGYTEDNIIKFD